MRTTVNDISAEKESGKFYTPDFIVKNILDLANYTGKQILKKHVIDNSCGDGAFLCEIVTRYCEAALKSGYNDAMLKHDLAYYIHGIERESVEANKCIANISKLSQKYNVKGVKWDIQCDDALNVSKYDGKMDYVLGNPPYVRVHNLDESIDITKFSFAQKGMKDLYIVFFELGIKMLKSKGVLGYITPSSYFTSLAGSYMRNYIKKENLLKKIVDLQHFQAFSATTYTAITILEKGKKEETVDYYRYDAKECKAYFIEKLKPCYYQLADNYYFSTSDALVELKNIICNKKKSSVSVKNGYATLCDSIFINDFPFESKYIIPVIKSSRGIKQKIIYPYDEQGRLFSEEKLQEDKNVYNYLLKYKERLLKRNNNYSWYAYGRNQAISDTFRDKIAINALVRNKEDLKFIKAPAGTGTYGGLYIVSDKIPCEDIISVLKTDAFLSYVELLGKYKSGGYYTYSSKDVKLYIDYKLGELI